MRTKTKKQLKRAILYALIFVFVAGTFLLYLPLTQPQPENNPPPLDQIPQGQQNPPAVDTTAAPLPQ